MTEDLSDFDQFSGALRQTEEIAAPFAEAAMGLYLDALQKQMRPYPDQPDRDRANPGVPSPYNKYVRGIGTFPRSAFVQIDNQWQRKKKGAYKKGPKGGTVHYTSEDLRTKWKIEVRSESGGIRGELRNDASYSGLVLGHKAGVLSDDDIPQQAAPHTLTGWPNVDDGLASAESTKDHVFDQAIIQTIQAIIAGG